MGMAVSSRYSKVWHRLMVVAALTVSAPGMAQTEGDYVEPSYEPNAPAPKPTKKKRKKKAPPSEVPAPAAVVPVAPPSNPPAAPAAEGAAVTAKKPPTLKEELKKRYARNAVFELLAGAEATPTNSLEVLLGNDTNPTVTHFGGELRFFLPEPVAVPWLNWIGFFYGMASTQSTSVAFIRSGDSQPVRATVSGASQHAGIAIRVPFLDSAFSAIQMEIDGLNQFEETVSEVPAAANLTSDLTYRVSGPVVNLGLELTPAKNVFFGLDFRAPVSQKLKAVEKRSNGVTAETSGKWQRLQVVGFAGFRYFATREWYFAGTGQFGYRQDKVAGSELLTKEISIGVTEFSGLFAVGFVPVNAP
jgi:hypothetical protein